MSDETGMTRDEALEQLGEALVASERDFKAAQGELARLRAELAEARAGRSSCVDDDGTPFASARSWRARVRELEAGALRLLQASELGVSEAEGMRRAAELAKLVGYAAGPQAEPPRGLPDDLAVVTRETYRLAGLLSKEVEGPAGWRFALFIFRDPAGGRPGDVLQVSRDRDLTKLAVARWLRDLLDAQGAKARG